MDNRTELPTESKIEKLRAEGIVPLSYFSVKAASAIGGTLGLFLVHGGFWRFCEAYRQLATGNNPLAPAMGALLHEVLALIVVPAVLTLLFGSVAVLAQTKFLIRFSAFAFNLGKLPRLSRVVHGDILGSVVGSFIAVAVSILIGAFSFYLLSPLLLSFLNLKERDVLSTWWGAVSIVVPLLFTFLALVAFFSWLIQRYRFMLKHRMTRAEMESEARDDRRSI